MASSSFPFDNLPNEMKFAVLSHLPLSSLLRFRLVSSSCKNLVSAFHHNFTCHITDLSYRHAVKGTENFSTVKVSNFTQAKYHPSRPDGDAIGPLLSTAKRLHLIGSNIAERELQKIGFHSGRVSELVLEQTGGLVLTAVLGSGFNSFQNLTTLTLLLPNVGLEPESLLTLSHLAHQNYLPNVGNVRFQWTTTGRTLLPPEQQEIQKALLYLNSVKVIIGLCSSLKSLEIERDLLVIRDMETFLCQDLALEDITPLQGALRNLKLERLKLTSFVGEGLYRPCSLEHELIQGQAENLKELAVRKTFLLHLVNGRQLRLPRWNSLLPAEPSPNLTKVTLECSPYQTEPLSLRYFKKCLVLKELILNCYCDQYGARLEHQITRISDLERLPQALEHLQFIPSRKELAFGNNQGHLAESCVLLRQDQLEWLAGGNLPKLRYLGCMLIATSKKWGQNAKAPAVRNNLKRKDLMVKNVDLPLFQKLVRLKQMKKLEVNLVHDSGLINNVRNNDAANIYTPNPGNKVFDSYFQFCRGAKDVVFVESVPVPGKYFAVTIKK